MASAYRSLFLETLEVRGREKERKNGKRKGQGKRKGKENGMEKGKGKSNAMHCIGQTTKQTHRKVLGVSLKNMGKTDYLW